MIEMTLLHIIEKDNLLYTLHSHSQFWHALLYCDIITKKHLATKLFLKNAKTW